MTSRIALCLFFLLTTLNLAAQVTETAAPDYIKTIQFKSAKIESQLPILRLGEPLRLEFDALNGLEPDFYYVIEHFNYDWTPSNLVKSEYLQDFETSILSLNLVSSPIMQLNLSGMNFAYLYISKMIFT